VSHSPAAGPRLVNDLPRHADVVFVGAGHNALVAAAYLLEAGRSVVLLDQMSQPGGWVRTAELGVPGFHHDRWSAMHPAFVGGPAWAELGTDLKRHGLEYVTAPLATGSSLPGGRTAVLPVDPQQLAAELDRLGETAGWGGLFATARQQLPALLELAGDGLDSPEAQAALSRLLVSDRDSALPFGQLLSDSAADLVRRQFATEELRYLAAPWTLHLGIGPEDPAGALWTLFGLGTMTAGNPAPAYDRTRLPGPGSSRSLGRFSSSCPSSQISETLIRAPQPTCRTTAGGPSGPARLRSPHSMNASRIGISSRPGPLSRYSCRSRAPSSR
jgi:hypothetical protein